MAIACIEEIRVGYLRRRRHGRDLARVCCVGSTPAGKHELTLHAPRGGPFFFLFFWLVASLVDSGVGEQELGAPMSPPTGGVDVEVADKGASAASGGVGSGDEVEDQSWVERLNPKTRRVVGVLMALSAGVFYGLSFDPVDYGMVAGCAWTRRCQCAALL